MVDPFIGKYSFVKVCSGVLKGDDVLTIRIQIQKQSLVNFIRLSETNRSGSQELFAGDIGAIAKLTNTRTGDTLSTKDYRFLWKTDYSKPYTYMKYIVKKKVMRIRCLRLLRSMMAEDVTLKAGR